LIRQAPGLIEGGLTYVDHQRLTDRGPLDVLLVDSGNALVVAELKVVEDDSMLVQGIDYYDFVTRNIEGMCRIYKQFKPDPAQPVRLFLIAPSFSVQLQMHSAGGN
jgi:RecB family endonuclease NucS